jgi:hypothetical protein
MQVIICEVSYYGQCLCADGHLTERWIQRKGTIHQGQGKFACVSLPRLKAHEFLKL